MKKPALASSDNPTDNPPKKSARHQTRVNDILSERQGALPVWVRAPKFGHEYFSGTSRAKLYEWDSKGYIRSVSIREPGQVKGSRFFHLGSILAFIEKCAAETDDERARNQQASTNVSKGDAE